MVVKILAMGTIIKNHLCLNIIILFFNLFIYLVPQCPTTTSYWTKKIKFQSPFFSAIGGGFFGWQSDRRQKSVTCALKNTGRIARGWAERGGAAGWGAAATFLEILMLLLFHLNCSRNWNRDRIVDIIGLKRRTKSQFCGVVFPQDQPLFWPKASDGCCCSYREEKS